jgi:CheY-like chemotaxis protein
MKILIVEDNEEYIENYKELIKNFNEKNPDSNIEVRWAADVKSGIESIRENKFDGAIIDLKIPSESGSDPHIQNTNGEKIIEDISMERKFPVAVVSGYADSIDEKYIKKKGLFLKIYRRGDEDIGEILADFVLINKAGIAEVFGRGGKIEEFIDEIYYKNIQSAVRADKNIKEKGILRYFSIVLQEHLDIRSSGSFDEYSLFEFYIAPPVKEFHFTGEIIKKTEVGVDNKYVILTPACDMDTRGDSNCEINNVVCVKIISGDDIIKIEDKTAKNRKNQNKYLDDDIKPNKNKRYHYLPEISGIMDENSFIDFRHIRTFDKLDDNIKSVATISAPFLKDIIARFSHYYSRQGQPELKIINQK